MQIYDSNIINIYKMISENHTEFFSGCVAVQIGFLAFVAPKLLEINNEIQNISKTLFELFNRDRKYTLFQIYVITISIFLALSIIPLLFNIDSIICIFFCFIFFVTSIIFSTHILIKIDYFHNKTICLSAKYKYKTPEKKIKTNKNVGVSLAYNPQNETPNIKWNNRILNLWEQVATHKINQNANTALIMEIIDDGILPFWNNYSKGVENGDIDTSEWEVFFSGNYIIYPLSKITYLNQIATSNRNSELSYYLINSLIGLIINTNNFLSKEIESKFLQAIIYKIKYSYFDDYFDMKNISAFIFYKLEKINKTPDVTKNIGKLLDEFKPIVDISKNMIANYKNILINKNWQEMLSNNAMGEVGCRIIQYTNIEILKCFLIQNEYNLIYDYMNYYKNFENNYTTSSNASQYWIFPLKVSDWNFVLDEKWNITQEGKFRYTIKYEYLDIFFLCRLKHYINMDINNKLRSKMGLDNINPEEPKNVEKLKAKFISTTERIIQFFDNVELLRPWKLNNEEIEHYKAQMLSDIEETEK